MGDTVWNDRFGRGAVYATAVLRHQPGQRYLLGIAFSDRPANVTVLQQRGSSGERRCDTVSERSGPANIGGMLRKPLHL